MKFNKKFMNLSSIDINRILIFFLIVSFVSSCANIGTISGGETDKTPPQIVRENPNNFITNFNNKKIVIHFDEYLANTNIRNEISITPNLPKKPQVQIKGKSIEIYLDENLEKNTTYIINFGRGIADLNENNVLDGYFYVFSTGNHIDSNSITGSVFDGISNTPVQNCLVGMFTNNLSNLDSLLKNRPEYYTKTDSSGNFIFKYLPYKTFFILAFLDKNNDFIFQPEAEDAGRYPRFKSSSDSIPVFIYLFPEEPKPKPVAYRLINPYACFITYQAPIHSFHVQYAGNNQIVHVHRNENRDTLFVFFRDEVKDTLSIQISAPFSTDSILVPPRRTLAMEKLKIDIAERPFFSEEDTVFIISNYPIHKIDTSKISIYSSDSIKIKGFEILTVSKNLFKLFFPKKPNTKYHLTVIPEGFFYNEKVFNTDTVIFDIETKGKEDFGELNIETTVDTFLTNLYVIVSDKKGREIARFLLHKSTETFHIRNLLPDSYKLTLFWDKNGNEWWDKASLIKNQPAEVKVLYPEDIGVRANWELDISWKIPLSDALKRFGY